MFIIQTQKGSVSAFSRPEREMIQFTQTDTLKMKFHDEVLAQSFIFSNWNNMRGIGSKVVRWVPERKGGASASAFHNADPSSIRKGK